MAREYNDPTNVLGAGAVASGVGTQLRTDNFVKQALIEAKKQTFFGALADVTAMPKNMGKKIKRYHYVPLLDDANINDQGLNAEGSSTASIDVTMVITNATGEIPRLGSLATNATIVGNKAYVTGTSTTNLLASDIVRDKFIAWCASPVSAGGLGIASTNGTADGKFGELLADAAMTGGAASAYQKGYRFKDIAGTTITAVAGLDASQEPATGNLYGSSKDIGTITGKFPTLTETGGKVNRVGFTRVELEGSLKKYGFYDEYTQESLDFDSDAELEMHITREMIFGANEIVEDLLQLDLINSAGLVFYPGAATSNATISGTAGSETVVSYADLTRLSVELDNNRCPKTTKVISGSRMVDTRVIRGGRVMYVGSELTLTLEQMTDHFDNQAFISVAHYADAGTILEGEIGTVGQFRIVVVPEMMYWAGAGATETPSTNTGGYRASNAKYDVFPMLVVGDGSFTTIGFQTSGNNSKFTIKHSKPGSPESFANDPYGELGFMSIKWYYGFMALRPERIALIKTAAKY